MPDISSLALTLGKEKQWDEFCQKQAGCRFSFLVGFRKAVEASFGYEAKYFIFEKDGGIVGVLPTFLSGGKLISIPFGVYGGVLGDLSGEEIAFVFAQIKQEFPKIKIIGTEQVGLEKSGFYSAIIQKFGVLDLDSLENLWNNKLDRSAKKNIKRAEKEALEVFCDNSVDLLKKHFYPLYLDEMKRFGTPPYPLHFFLNLIKFLGDKIKIVYIKNKEGKVISSLFGVGGGSTFYIHFNPSNPKFNYQRPNDIAHWRLIEEAFKAGYKYFDFGPMRYAGQIQFKRKWGVEERDYYVYSTEEIKIGESKLQHLTSWVWRYFMPNFLAKRIGPIIRKKLAK